MRRSESVPMSVEELRVSAKKNPYLSSVLIPPLKRKKTCLVLEKKRRPLDETSGQRDVPHVIKDAVSTPVGTAFGSFGTSLNAFSTLPPQPAYIFNPYFKGMGVVPPPPARLKQPLLWREGGKELVERRKFLRAKKVETREPPSMQTIAKAISVISLVYSTLDDPRGIPKDFWGLSKETDRVAARYLKFPNTVPDERQKALAEESRFPVLGVIFGTRFNDSVDLKEGIKKVHFRWAYDKPTVLPRSVIEVEFSRFFNHPVVLPPALRKVKFCRVFNHPIELPDTVTDAAFGMRFNQDIRLPPRLRTLVFGTDFKTELGPLPDTLEKEI